MGKRGNAHLRGLLRNFVFVRPVEWIDPQPDSGPKFIFPGGCYSVFLRRLRERITVTLQRANANFIRRWASSCVLAVAPAVCPFAPPPQWGRPLAPAQRM